jgi:hypothetical protein
MKAKAGKQRQSKRHDAATPEIAEIKWPVLLDQLAIIEPQRRIIFFTDETKRLSVPEKLRGKPSELRTFFLDWLKLPEEQKFYWVDGFWRDLCMGNVKFPLVIPELMQVLWRTTRQATQGASEELRELADCIDALNAKKGDRGQRRLVTELLYDYAIRVRANEHPELPWPELREKFWPDYQDTNQNFQKFLRERGIPFKRVGEFRKRNRVRNRKKNTRSQQ